MIKFNYETPQNTNIVSKLKTFTLSDSIQSKTYQKQITSCSGTKLLVTTFWFLQLAMVKVTSVLF
jgi:hypothetical protein